MFIGAKMIAEPWLHIPVQISLAAVAGMLSIALLASMLIPPQKKE
jgi:predicted tellurium resistance membrane protein TerC